MIVPIVLAVFLVSGTQGHMSLQVPPARNVMWRMGFSNLPVHQDDDYLICNEKGGRKCPPCGDKIDTPPPHPHEAGGFFATGLITETYTVGQTIDAHVNVTRSHGGYLEFKLCPNNDVKRPVSQRCLDKYPLEIEKDGRILKRIDITAPYDTKEQIYMKLILPPGLSCEQCVLQMSNTAEQFKPSTIMFRNCADIAITDESKSAFASGPPLAFNSRAHAAPPPPHRFGGHREPFPSQRQHSFFSG